MFKNTIMMSLSTTSTLSPTLSLVYLQLYKTFHAFKIVDQQIRRCQCRSILLKRLSCKIKDSQDPLEGLSVPDVLIVNVNFIWFDLCLTQLQLLCLLATSRSITWLRFPRCMSAAAPCLITQFKQRIYFALDTGSLCLEQGTAIILLRLLLFWAF